MARSTTQKPSSPLGRLVTKSEATRRVSPPQPVAPVPQVVEETSPVITPPPEKLPEVQLKEPPNAEPEPAPVFPHTTTEKECPLYGGFRSLGNQGKFDRAVQILRTMYRFAETSKLFGTVGIEVTFQNGEANVVRKQLNGTEK